MAYHLLHHSRAGHGSGYVMQVVPAVWQSTQPVECPSATHCYCALSLAECLFKTFSRHPTHGVKRVVPLQFAPGNSSILHGAGAEAGAGVNAAMPVLHLLLFLWAGAAAHVRLNRMCQPCNGTLHDICLISNGLQAEGSSALTCCWLGLVPGGPQ